MADDKQVEIVAAPGVKAQFGKHLPYAKKRVVAWRPLVATGIVLSIAILAVVVIAPNQPNDGETTVSSFLGLDRIVVTHPSLSIALPPAVSPASGTASVTEKKKKPSKSVPTAAISYLGPESIRRPKLIVGAEGVVVEAMLTTGASNGVVHAKLKEDLIARGEVLAEEGTLLIGLGQSGEERLMIRFHKAVFSDGSSAKIQAQALDGDDQIPGIKGSKVGQHGLRLATGIGLNFVGGVSEALQDYDGEDGAVVRRPTLKNALLHGSARAALDHSQETLSDIRNEPTVIEVPKGSTIHVAFEGGEEE